MVLGLQVLALLFEKLSIVIVPFCDLHIQDVVVEVLDVLQIFGELVSPDLAESAEFQK